MRVAVASTDTRGLEGQVAQHFGRCPYFTFVDVEDGEIQQVVVLPNPFYHAHEPGEVPGFIHQQGADIMVAGSMGGRAVSFFQQVSVQAFSGAAGTVKEGVEMALGGQLEVAAGCTAHTEGDCGDHDHGHHHA